MVPRKSTTQPKQPTAGRRATGGSDDNRRTILRLLAANPNGLNGGEVAKRLNVSDAMAGYYLKHPWFKKADPANRLSPWVLSPVGEKAASESSQTPARGT